MSLFYRMILSKVRNFLGSCSSYRSPPCGRSTAHQSRRRRRFARGSREVAPPRRNRGGGGGFRRPDQPAAPPAHAGRIRAVPAGQSPVPGPCLKNRPRDRDAAPVAAETRMSIAASSSAPPYRKPTPLLAVELWRPSGQRLRFQAVPAGAGRAIPPSCAGRSSDCAATQGLPPNFTLRPFGERGSGALSTPRDPVTGIIFSHARTESFQLLHLKANANILMTS